MGAVTSASGAALLIVSADGHCGAKPDAYRDYLEARYHGVLDDLIAEDDRRDRQIASFLAVPDDVLEVIDDRGAIRSGGVAGSWDVARRLRELDDDAITAELLFPNQQCALMPFFSVTNRPHARELRAAGARAYHRWLADFMADSDGRLFGVLDPFVGDGVEATMAELSWAAERSFVSMTLPGAVVDDTPAPPLWDPCYEPLWSQCEEIGIVLSVHAGHGHRQGELAASMDRMAELGLTRADVMGRMHDGSNPLHRPSDLTPRAALWQLMLAGVFDRHPQLRLALTELHADWLPATLAALDARFAHGDTSLQRPPSEYWAQHGAVTVSSVRRVEIERRDEIGVGNMLFGTDYVQPESTWPNTLDWLRDALRGVPEGEARAILGTNAVGLYGLDGPHLAGVAARVGPAPADVLGDHDVDPRKLADFSLRAGYALPAEAVDQSAVVAAFEHDLARKHSGVTAG